MSGGVKEVSAEYRSGELLDACPVGYKRTEVGILPEEWEVSPISKKMELINGYGFKPSQWSLHGLPIIRIQNLNDEDAEFNYFEGSIDSKFHVKNGDLLFAWSGSKGSSFGARIWKRQTAVLNQHIFRVVPDNDSLTGKYAYLVLRRVQEEIEKMAHGFKSSFVHVKKSDLLTTLLPIPPKDEQIAIANALSDVDALITSLETLITKKRAIKTATMQQLLTGKKRLPPFEKTHTGYKQTELGEIPEDWEVKTVYQIVGEQKSQFDDGDWVEAEHITDKGVRLIQTGNIGVGEYIERGSKKYIYEESFTKLGCKELIEGDLLICRLAEPAGRACIFPGLEDDKVITSVDVTIYRPNENEISREYLRQYFSTSHWFKSVSEHVGGTTHKRISRGALGRIFIPLATYDEQVQIANVLAEMDRDLKSLVQRLTKTQQLKQGMMQELLTGKTRLI